jgi:hypothetical protein
VFEAYVEHFLAPNPEEGQIVVTNVLVAHRTDGVREPIEGMRAVVLAGLLSRPLIPSKKRSRRRRDSPWKAAARTREALAEAMSGALSAITPHAPTEAPTPKVLMAESIANSIGALSVEAPRLRSHTATRTQSTAKASKT